MWQTLIGMMKALQIKRCSATLTLEVDTGTFMVGQTSPSIRIQLI